MSARAAMFWERLDCAELSEYAWMIDMSELIFEVTQEADGGYCAESLTENIFTQGDSWDELRANVKEAVAAFYFDKPAPQHVRLRLVSYEAIALP